MQRIEISDRQALLNVDPGRIREAIGCVLDGEGIPLAEISVALVDDPTIREVNGRFLGHDYATDVISFPLSEENGPLEGDLMVSTQTAIRSAPAYGWQPEEELILYLIHGTLHLVGYDDQEPASARQMRDKEDGYLERLGMRRGRTASEAAPPGPGGDER